MRRSSISVCLAAFAVILLCTALNSMAAGRKVAGQPWGTWYWVTDLSVFGPGMEGTSLPTLIVLSSDGTFSCAEGNAFGGYEGAAEVYSEGHGTWVKTNRGTFLGTRLSMIFDKDTGVLIGIGRSRFSFGFAGDFNHIKGTLFTEALYCMDGPFFCPDPLDPEAPWVPTSPPGGFPATATHLDALPAGDLPLP